MIGAGKMSQTSPKSTVAFIIVGWNNRPLLADCFDSIAKQTYKPVQVIYVDNASTDGSVDWVSQHWPDVKILAQDTNTGFAKGNNLGMAAALEMPGVGYLALINSDARLDPTWAEQLTRFAGRKPKGACFQGTTLDYYNHAIIDSTHIFVARNGQGTQGNWRLYLANELGPRKIFGSNAAACLITRAFIEGQPFGSLFDETLYMYLEDIDLASRATIMGWDNWLVPAARAYHMGSVSAAKRSSSFSLYMTFRNNSAVLFKNFPSRLILRMLPRLIRGDLDTIIELRRRGQSQSIWPVIKGRVLGILRLPLFVGKRLKMRHYRRIDSDYLWRLMDEGY